MDENNNLENPNLNNWNINNTNNAGNSNINPQSNPYDQSTEENPYYNPYFQNTTIGNSPYFDNSNIVLNNDIYSQTYMDMNNSQEDSQFQSSTENQTSMKTTEEELNNQNVLPNDEEKLINQNDLQNSQEQLSNQADLPNTEVTSNNQIANSDAPLNLFDLSNSNDVQNNNPIENTQVNNNQDVATLNTQNNSTFEPTQNNIHINPILSQNINQSSTEQPQNLNNNQFNNNVQNFVNNEFENNTQNSNNGFINQTTNSYGTDNDDEFKRNWMGKLYDKAKYRKFSIPAFFFGGLYYLYRKLYIFGFIFLILSCIIPIIGSSLISSAAETGNATIPFIITFVLPILINIIYGFIFYPIYNNNIKNSLNNLKNQVQSPNQLLDEAKKRGGTSIGFLLLGILLSSIINLIALSTIIMSAISNFANMFGALVPQDDSNTISNTNEIPETVYDTINFYNNYSFEYDSSVWMPVSNNSLVNGTYTLSYIQSIENLINVGFDINQNNGRSSFFTYLYNLFSSQIDASTTTLELGSSSFMYDNGIYYSYFDLVYATSIERCYFVLIPEDDIFIEFILSNNDTVITDEVNSQVLSSLSSITSLNQESLNSNSLYGYSANGSLISNVINVND